MKLREDIVFERLYPESFRDTSEVPTPKVFGVGTENERKYYILFLGIRFLDKKVTFLFL